MNNCIYLPVLRWKSAEQSALTDLDSKTGNRIKPVIEVVPKYFSKYGPQAGAKKIVLDLARHWRKPAFLDVSLLNPDTAASAIPFLRKELDWYHCEVGIVTELSHPSNLQDAIREHFRDSELCLRLRSRDMNRNAIADLLRFHSRKPSQAHVIIDFEAVASDSVPIQDALKLLPKLDEWNSATVLLGAFPPDLSSLEKNSQHELPRYDWLSWLNFISSHRGRSINFGDYNIHSGLFIDNEGKKRNFSASLRYTSRDYWVIMRGEGVLNEDGPGFSQYPAQALLLSERTEFCGPGFCTGDSYIHSMGQQNVVNGGIKEWLKATLNHHLTFVPWQLSGLSAA